MSEWNDRDITDNPVVFRLAIQSVAKYHCSRRGNPKWRQWSCCWPKSRSSLISKGYLICPWRCSNWNKPQHLILPSYTYKRTHTHMWVAHGRIICFYVLLSHIVETAKGISKRYNADASCIMFIGQKKFFYFVVLQWGEYSYVFYSLAGSFQIGTNIFKMSCFVFIIVWS
jgi:hypothetical protein